MHITFLSFTDLDGFWPPPQFVFILYYALPSFTSSSTHIPESSIHLFLPLPRLLLTSTFQCTNFFFVIFSLLHALNKPLFGTLQTSLCPFFSIYFQISINTQVLNFLLFQHTTENITALNDGSQSTERLIGLMHHTSLMSVTKSPQSILTSFSKRYKHSPSIERLHRSRTHRFLVSPYFIVS